MSWIEILKTGKWKDSSGKEHSFTEKDLEEIAKKYEERTNDAPVVVGHPKDNSPAYGWVEKLKKEGNVLKAKIKDLVPEFVDAVKKRMYKYVSVSLYPDNRLRHIGFLGGMPPAVKGLEAVQFSNDEEYVTFEFAEDSWTEDKIFTIANIFQKIRDFFIEKFGKDSTDKIINSWDIDWLKTPQPAKVEEESFSEEKNKQEVRSMEELEKMKTKLKEAEEKIKEFSEKASSVEEENKKLKEKIEALEKEKTEKEINDFVEKLKKEGKVLPHEEKVVKETLWKLKGDDEKVEFSEGEEKSRYEAFKEFLEKQKVKVPLGELGKEEEKEKKVEDFGENVDEDALELHKKAIQLSEKENISYEEAVIKIRKEG